MELHDKRLSVRSEHLSIFCLCSEAEKIKNGMITFAPFIGRMGYDLQGMVGAHKEVMLRLPFFSSLQLTSTPLDSPGPSTCGVPGVYTTHSHAIGIFVTYHHWAGSPSSRYAILFHPP